MKIADIYKKFSVPPNLQEHMQKVYGVVNFLEQHWIGKEKIDWNFVKKATLVHDLGNIVRFDFDSHPEFLKEEQSRLDYWRDVQREMVEKYGKDDNEVTRKMLQEAEVGEELIRGHFGKRIR